MTEENDVKEQVKSDSITVKSQADSYQPEPVQNPEFNFKGLSQTEIEGDNKMTAGEYFRKKNGSCLG